jgi:hypothetical protein
MREPGSLGTDEETVSGLQFNFTPPRRTRSARSAALGSAVTLVPKELKDSYRSSEYILGEALPGSRLIRDARQSRTGATRARQSEGARPHFLLARCPLRGDLPSMMSFPNRMHSRTASSFVGKILLAE